MENIKLGRGYTCRYYAWMNFAARPVTSQPLHRSSDGLASRPTERDESMSYTVLRFVRACMLAGIASGTAVDFAGPALAQTPTTPTVTGTGVATDPGVRGGPPGAGSALKGLSPTEIDFFNAARNRFQ